MQLNVFEVLLMIIILQQSIFYFLLCQAGLRNIEGEPAPELRRAISGDLFSDDEFDQATDEAVEG